MRIAIIPDPSGASAFYRAQFDKFTQQTGIRVELVGVEEDQFIQVLTSSAAAGELPDVIGSIPLSSVRTLSTNDLLNTDAAAVPRRCRRYGGCPPWSRRLRPSAWR